MTIAATLGPLFIGTVVAAAMWGVSCVQLWFYFDNYREDSTFLKCLVIATWISDTIHQMLITHVSFTYAVSHFGDLETAREVLWSVYVEVIFNAITGFLVQAFFTHRIWQISRSRWVIMGLAVLVLAEFAASIAYVAHGLLKGYDTYAKLRYLKALSMSINALAAGADVAISIAICTLLNNSKTGFSWSNHVINRLILFAINTGLLTSLCAICSLIFILVSPDTLIYFVFYYLIGRLYSNSLLATLNARKRIRASQPSGESHSLQDRDRERSFGQRLRGLKQRNRSIDDNHNGVQVQIDTIQHTSEHHVRSCDITFAGVDETSEHERLDKIDEHESTGSGKVHSLL